MYYRRMTEGTLLHLMCFCLSCDWCTPQIIQFEVKDKESMKFHPFGPLLGQYMVIPPCQRENS